MLAKRIGGISIVIKCLFQAFMEKEAWRQIAIMEEIHL
jgi:hypothetical protein